MTDDSATHDPTESRDITGDGIPSDTQAQNVRDDGERSSARGRTDAPYLGEWRDFLENRRRHLIPNDEQDIEPLREFVNRAETGHDNHDMAMSEMVRIARSVLIGTHTAQDE